VVAKRAGAPPGSVVRLHVAGEVSFDHAVLVDNDHRGRLLSATPEAVTSLINMGWESFARLSCGRIPLAGVDVSVTGDTELGGRVLDHLSITP
jgi:hypothetical protein